MEECALSTRRVSASFMPTALPPVQILLVEDSDDDAFFMERSLRLASIESQVTRARDGEEAIQFFQHLNGKTGSSPLVVFLDLKMPGMSGFDVLRWVRKQPSMPLPEIVILSGSDQDSDIEMAMDMGAKAYLVKPPTPEILRECLLARLQNLEHERRASKES